MGEGLSTTVGVVAVVVGMAVVFVEIEVIFVGVSSAFMGTAAIFVGVSSLFVEVLAINRGVSSAFMGIATLSAPRGVEEGAGTVGVGLILCIGLEDCSEGGSDLASGLESWLKSLYAGLMLVISVTRRRGEYMVDD